MANVLIIGAGGVGQVTTHKCAQLPGIFSSITLASRTGEKCRRIASRVAETLGVSINTAEVDANQVSQVKALIEQVEPEVVINVALPYQNLAIMQACLEMGVHYLDTANYESPDNPSFEYKEQWAYQDRYAEAGVTALLGSGFDPGGTNAFTAYLAKHYFDELRRLNIIDVNGGDHGYPFATNFNPEINIREVTAPCRHWENGELVTTPAMSEKRRFTCPEEVGAYDIYRMYHEELESLVINYPTLEKVQFWMSFSENYLKHLEVLENVGMTGIEPVEFQGQRIVPIQFLQAVLPNPSTLGPRTVGKACIGCVGEGIVNDRERQVYIYTICDHQEAYRETGSQAVSYTTGVPAMIGAKLLVEGTWKKPGVWNIEQLDPDPYLADLSRYGLPWRVVEEPGIELD